MKLLLTSAGVRNQSIADALATLHGRPVEEIKIGFVPTAANAEPGNKDWFLAQFVRLTGYGYQWIDIVDIAVSSIDWKSRLDAVDVIVMSGGNTFYLLDQVRRSSFGEWLRVNLETKVYVGISAGSIIVTPSVAIASVDNGDINLPGLTDFTGISLVPFEVSPHTPELVSHEGNKAYKAGMQNDLYALDDASALKVVGDTVEVVSEGSWVRY